MMVGLHRVQLRYIYLSCVVVSLASTNVNGMLTYHNLTSGKNGRTFYGVGGLSGGGATSTFLEAYQTVQRDQILDLLFKPNYAASLNILKVEIGSDDQTTDGCEGCHMRSATDLNCYRGYEWSLMKQAVQRNPDITLYGLPWGWAGWLGHNTSNPYSDPAVTADYTAKWIECGRDAHGLNITVIGIWNEADSYWAPNTGTFDYILALRHRLDSSGLQHVKIIAPDGGINAAAQTLSKNASLRAAVWGLGQHYPGAAGTNAIEMNLKLPLWSSEDYSTYSDATGAGCWGRLLVQNAGWGYAATISWYLLGSFARGMDYDSDGLVRAEWPTSGHFEITPMLWITMHWTQFVQPSWVMLECPDANYPYVDTGRCALEGGGNYIAVVSPDAADVAIIIHAFEHNTSQCIRNDPKDWRVEDTQTVTFGLGNVSPLPTTLQVYRSCSSWVYPSDNDVYMQKISPLTVNTANKSVTVQVDRNCYYTLTTSTAAVTKPTNANPPPKSAAFPLPYREDFDGPQVGSEAPYFGDQMGKFETVVALGGGSHGNASQQQLAVDKPWPIDHPGCLHSQPISIVGDMFFRDVRVSADVFIVDEMTGAALAVRTRNPQTFWRAVAPGLYLFINAIPGVGDGGSTHGGILPPPSTLIHGWQLCTDSYCKGAPLASGSLSGGGLTGEWHTLSLAVVGEFASGTLDNTTLFTNVQLRGATPSPKECVANTTVQPGVMIVGGDYRETQLANSSVAEIQRCVETCCEDLQCDGWAVATSGGASNADCQHGSICCFLKNGGSIQKGNGEIASAKKPSSSNNAPFDGLLPQTGWAAIVTTLGKVQFDNFEVEGLSKGGHATTACGGGSPQAGDAVVATACDAPGSQNMWQRDDKGRLTFASSGLCLGEGGGGAMLVPCDYDSGVKPRTIVNPLTLSHDLTTGRIVSESGACVDVQTISAIATTPNWPRVVANASCHAIPADSQQYQFNPNTGELRPKASVCIAGFQNSVNAYRDCCLAICNKA